MSQDHTGDFQERGKSIHEELNERVLGFLRELNMSYSDYRTYISEPRNFSQTAWNALEQQQQTNVEKLNELREQLHIPRVMAPQPRPRHPLTQWLHMGRL